MNQSVMSGYTDAIAQLPQEAFLGSLLYFTISNADVNLEQAHQDLADLGLRTDTLRKRLRPVDAFNKATREFAHKFKPQDGIRSEIMVRAVGVDGEQVHRHLVLERAVVERGKKRRLAYDKVGEVTFVRGELKKGEYSGHSVSARQTTEFISRGLTDEEEGFLAARLDTFGSRFDHLLHYMDSHAVRTAIREYIYRLSGVLVRESGGLYFVHQGHVEELTKLKGWVESVGSTFHMLPLLNLAEQRDMILEAFEEETIAEVERLMGEMKKILSDPSRMIEATTFDNYGQRAAELTSKVAEYNEMLGARADRASIEVSLYKQQVLQLSNRIKTSTKVQVSR